MTQNNDTGFVCYLSTDTSYATCMEGKFGVDTGVSNCCVMDFLLYHDLDKTYSFCNTSKEAETASPYLNCSGKFLHDIDPKVGCLREYLWTFIGDCSNDIDKVLLPFQTLNIFLNIVMFLIGSFFNCSLITIFCRHRSLWKPLNLYILSAVLAEQLLVIVYLPLDTVSKLMDEWGLGKSGCKILNSSFTLFMTVMVYITAALSVERHNIIVKGTYNSSRVWTRVILVNCIVWVFAIFYAVPPFLTSGISEFNNECDSFQSEVNIFLFCYHITEALVFFIIPFTVIAIFYIKTYLKIQNIQECVRIESRRNDDVQSPKEIARLLIIIVSLFFVFNFLWSIRFIIILSYALLFNVDSSMMFNYGVYNNVSASLCKFNLCATSVLVLIISVDIRQHFYNLFSFIPFKCIHAAQPIELNIQRQKDDSSTTSIVNDQTEV